MVETYKSVGDKWRTLGYEKAIMALKNHPKAVTSWEEARALKGVGERLADKIMEIIESGHLRKIDETSSEKRTAAVKLFTKVWGVGPNTANLFVQQGCNTLDDLKKKASLTRSQEIGLKYFDEIQMRMQRSEAEEIFKIVETEVKGFSSCIECIACGSYRRKRDTCGDLDILICDRSFPVIADLLPSLVQKLNAIGLLTDHLVCQDSKHHKKYMGICKLPGDDKVHRRIDLINVPPEEMACALLYFTGSAHFNRSMRLLATKQAMSLSEHCLRTGISREGTEKSEGCILSTPDERSIFEFLGLEYREPHERDYFAVE